MQDSETWRLLDDELDRWRASGRQARFWLRDDDAVVPTGSLQRLIDMTAGFALPVTLAVIPRDTGAPLADSLAEAAHVSVAVHGWSHENHAGPSDKKQELGPHRPQPVVLDELARGYDKLEALYGPQFNRMLVPPWNRIDAGLLAGLGALGYTAVSVFGKEKPAPIAMFNTHVDLIEWHGSRGGREPLALVTEIVARLKLMFDQDGHMGFLTHHLVHDEPAWQFLEAFIEQSSGHAGCGWVDASGLREPYKAGP